MIYLFCGLVVGVVMGLTGSGGALISIPLFMTFLYLPLKEASVLSLIVVMLGSFSNFINYKKFTNYKLGSLFVFTSALGSYVSAPFKRELPETGVAVLLSIVSFIALVQVWRPSKPKEHEKTPGILISGLIGLILGILTTFTGIGGGILIVPILLSFYKFDQNQALATSLLTVGFSSMLSFFIQVLAGAKVHLELSLVNLVLGTFLAAFLLKWLTQRWSPDSLIKIRKITFTLVIFLALAKVFST
jgi:uncharacterized membrane protein YfcA